MSHYITVAGSLTYDSKDKLFESIDPLIKGGWLSEEEDEYIWRNELGSAVVDTNAVCAETLTLTIPHSDYRNFTRVMSSVVNGSHSGTCKWYSTDGRNFLRLWKDGIFSTFDEPEMIVRLANTKDQCDLDVLTMQSDEWEQKYDDCDFYNHLSDVMEAALERI